MWKPAMTSYSQNYLAEVNQITARLDVAAIERTVELLLESAAVPAMLRMQ
jgi:hypothetical protein